MTRKTPLTAEEHAELGAALARIHGEIGRLTGTVSHAYALNSPQVRELVKVSHALIRVRSALDAALCREHPDQFDPRVYYPGVAASEDEPKERT